MKSGHTRQHILLRIILLLSACAASVSISAEPVILSCYFQGKIWGSASIDVENESVTLGIDFNYRIIKADEATIHAVQILPSKYKGGRPERLTIDRSTGTIERLMRGPLGGTFYYECKKPEKKLF